MKHILLATALLASFTSITLAADPPAKPKDRKTQVLEDRQIVGADESWVYNDLPKALEEAKKTGKPLLVVFRCIPCHACAGFDAKVLNEADKRLKERMERFVCVRIVQGNAMDLVQFQFDLDLSFTAFFMNADGTIYGRYGTRSDLKDTERDLSMESFEKAMDGAVALHKGYPANKASLAPKRGPEPKVTRPEQYPTLAKYRPELDYDGKVVESCLHCHQIRDAERVDLRKKGEPMTDKVVFPWPMPDVVGMKLSPKEKATILAVTPGSAADKAGLKADDAIQSINGQPILSIADVQFILHHTGDSGELKVVYDRPSNRKSPLTATITLASGWRRASDISWRTTSWEFRRMGLGGMFPGDMTDDERKAAGLDTKQMAFLLKHVGEYGEHAKAKQAGFRKGDIILSWDGMNTRMTESALLAYAMQKKKPGDRIEATILRAGKKMELVLTMP